MPAVAAGIVRRRRKAAIGQLDAPARLALEVDAVTTRALRPVDGLASSHLHGVGRIPTLNRPPARAEDITLQFTVWNYSLDTIQDNARKFEEQNPGIKVKVTDYTWTDYQDSLVLRFRSGTQTDIVYGGQDWLPAWAAAGWVVPL